MYTTWIELNRENLLHNVRALRRRIGDARLMAVVKGNAYGHGMMMVAEAIYEDVDWFGVNSLDEAMELAGAGFQKPVLILGATMPDRLREVVRFGFRQVVYNLDGARALASAAEDAGMYVPVHLKVETGTNRLGMRPEEVTKLVDAVRACSYLILEGIYTHFANVEDTMDGSYAEMQLARFEQAVSAAETERKIPLKHTAATAAAVLYDRTYFNLVRAGIGIYGLWPSEETRSAAAAAGVDWQPRPVLSWKTRIVHLNQLMMGESVGYGNTYVATRPRQIAVIPIGYYEGLDRGLSNRGRVLVGGRSVPIAGRVAMNMTMLDVSDVPGVQAGDEVVLIGQQGTAEQSAESIATQLDTINYEVVTRLSASLPRVWAKT